MEGVLELMERRGGGKQPKIFNAFRGCLLILQNGYLPLFRLDTNGPGLFFLLSSSSLVLALLRLY